MTRGMIALQALHTRGPLEPTGVGPSLRTLRELAGLSRREVALAMPGTISPAYLRRVEQDTAWASSQWVAAYTRVCALTLQTREPEGEAAN